MTACFSFQNLYFEAYSNFTRWTLSLKASWYRTSEILGSLVVLKRASPIVNTQHSLFCISSRVDCLNGSTRHGASILMLILLFLRSASNDLEILLTCLERPANCSYAAIFVWSRIFFTLKNFVRPSIGCAWKIISIGLIFRSSIKSVVSIYSCGRSDCLCVIFPSASPKLKACWIPSLSSC